MILHFLRYHEFNLRLLMIQCIILHFEIDKTIKYEQFWLETFLVILKFWPFTSQSPFGTVHKRRHQSRGRGFDKRWFYLRSLFSKNDDEGGRGAKNLKKLILQFVRLKKILITITKESIWQNIFLSALNWQSCSTVLLLLESFSWYLPRRWPVMLHIFRLDFAFTPHWIHDARPNILDNSDGPYLIFQLLERFFSLNLDRKPNLYSNFDRPCLLYSPLQ